MIRRYFHRVQIVSSDKYMNSNGEIQTFFRQNVSSIVLTLLIIFLSIIAASQSFGAEDKPNKISSSLWESLSSGQPADMIIEFHQKADLSAAYTMNWDERGIYVVETLKKVAQESQAEAIAYLKKQGIRYKTFFAGNKMHIQGVYLNAAIDLSNIPNVRSITKEKIIYLDPIIKDVIIPSGTTAWGISDTKADQFWDTYGKQGDGIVVANIDTGVQWDHPALVNQFKCPGAPTDPTCWYDPSDICGDSGACDNNGHGTHTMGTMVAKDDASLDYIAGMAPNAKWIACKGCESGSCSHSALNACADWILAPGGSSTNRPHIVNNSWGGSGGRDWYLDNVTAWRAAGIFPAFSAGNNYDCSSLGSPGDYQESFSTASHKSDRTISSFSSKGPSTFGHDPYTKPNISSPGSSICSTIPGSTWSCSYSGTSMASPHTAGAVALLWSCNSDLIGQIDQTFQTLQNRADSPPDGNCGSPEDGGNYTYGYGYLNVLAAGQSICGLECPSSISPTSVTGNALGGSGSISVTPSTDCSWTAESKTTWITITSGSSGKGSGTVVYSYTVNDTGSTRSGTIRAAGKTFTLTQPSIEIGPAVDNTDLVWTTGGDSNWFGQTSVFYYGGSAAQSGDIDFDEWSWVQTTVTGPAVLSFYWKVSSETGSAGLVFFVDDVDQFVITGEVGWEQKSYSVPSGTHTLTWAYWSEDRGSSGSDCGWLDRVEYYECTFGISPTSATGSATGGSGSIAVTASGGACTWTAVSNDAWITVTSGSPGTGSGTVSYSYTANDTGASRSGTITIAGETFTLTQQPTPCTYSISPTSATGSATGGSGSIAVTASGGACTWTAVSNDDAWITVTSGSPGTGSGTVSYSYTANDTGAPRTGTITIAGETFTLAQPPMVGSLSVLIVPKGAIDAGAQWRRVDTTTWRDSGFTENSIPVGARRVEFKAITGWTAPSTVEVTISNGQTATASGTYVQQVGTVVVNPDPDSINAPWTLTGPYSYNQSGTGDQTLSGLPVGNYTIAWGDVAGWTKPAGATQAVTDGGTTTFTGTYSNTGTNTSGGFFIIPNKKGGAAVIYLE